MFGTMTFFQEQGFKPWNLLLELVILHNNEQIIFIAIFQWIRNVLCSLSPRNLSSMIFKNTGIEHLGVWL